MVLKNLKKFNFLILFKGVNWFIKYFMSLLYYKLFFYNYFIKDKNYLHNKNWQNNKFIM